jgi:hypothetical protein
MCRRDHFGADLFRGAEFRQTEPRHVCVDVYDIGCRPAQPLVKQFSAANDNASLRLVTRDTWRNRVSIHPKPIQVVRALRLAQRFRRSDQDFVPRRPQSLRQLRYVNFGTAVGRRKVPARRLNNAQSKV